VSDAHGRPGEVKDAYVAFAIAFVLVAILGLIDRTGVIGRNLGAVVAAVFLLIPYRYCVKRDQYLEDYGFRTQPLILGLALGFGVIFVIFPIFALGFAAFYEVVCSESAPEFVSLLSPPGMCVRFDGLGGVHFPKLGWDTAEFLFVQLIVVALPEELFFRGFIHKLLEKAWPAKRTIWGGGVGKALIVSSALFAIGHLAVNMDPRRLAVFFPGLLFGWMRSKTGSILAGTIAHALSNLFIYLLERSFF
jgi:membrane protease YdiL (CAAX protease family)